MYHSVQPCRRLTWNGLPWITWGAGDLGVKLLMAATLLVPYRMAMAFLGWSWSPRPAA